MIDIDDRTNKPDIREICEFTSFQVFDELMLYMETEYGALPSVEYSGDTRLAGWNVKFRKSGKTLCTVYPRRGYFFLLLIVGRKEKQRTEELLPTFCDEFREKYNSTVEGMGQRWMVFSITGQDMLLEDIKQVVRLRRECR